MRILHLPSLVCSVLYPTHLSSLFLQRTHTLTHTHSHSGGQKTKLTPSWPLLCLQNKQNQLVKYTQTAALPWLQSHQPHQAAFTQTLPSYRAGKKQGKSRWRSHDSLWLERTSVLHWKKKLCPVHTMLIYCDAAAEKTVEHMLTLSKKHQHYIHNRCTGHYSVCSVTWWKYGCQGDGWSVYESQSLQFFLHQSYGPRCTNAAVCECVSPKYVL